MSFGVLGVMFVIRTAGGGQGGRPGFAGSLHFGSLAVSLALWECGPGTASHVPRHLPLRRKGQLLVESAASP